MERVGSGQTQSVPKQVLTCKMSNHVVVKLTHDVLHGTSVSVTLGNNLITI